MEKRQVIITSLVLGAAAAGSLLAVSQTQAHGIDAGFGDFAAKFAQRFNLNEADVQAFMEEQRAEGMVDMQLKMEEHLDQAVADGKITAEQKTAIVAKHEEMKANMEEIKSLPQAERKEALDQQREEMKAWAEANGLKDTFFLGGPGPGHKGMGFHGRGGFKLKTNH